jgi:hypothetical protein
VLPGVSPPLVLLESWQCEQRHVPMKVYSCFKQSDNQTRLNSPHIINSSSVLGIKNLHSGRNIKNRIQNVLDRRQSTNVNSTTTNKRKNGTFEHQEPTTSITGDKNEDESDTLD